MTELDRGPTNYRTGKDWTTALFLVGEGNEVLALQQMQQMQRCKERQRYSTTGFKSNPKWFLRRNQHNRYVLFGLPDSPPSH